MINFELAKQQFNTYINKNFDITDERIHHKVEHTYEVVKMAEYICEDLHLSKETAELAKLIALLHDIGRFDQAKLFHNLKDYQTLDHATLGVKILFDNNMIRDFIKDTQYDDIIKVAILNHNKYKIETKDLNKEQILHSKIIRDADKTDSFRGKVHANPYSLSNITKDDIENSLITEEIYQDFMSAQTILSPKRITPADIWVSYIAFIFDYNFTSGLKYIKEQDYINKLIDRFHYKEKDTQEKIENIRKFALNYIDKRITNEEKNP